MAYWPQEWLDPGAYFPQEFLSLYLSAFISLCCLHSWVWSPLLVERWPPAAPSLPTSNLEVLSHLVLPAKIPSLVLSLVPFLNQSLWPEGGVSCWLASPELHILPRGRMMGSVPLKPQALREDHFPKRIVIKIGKNWCWMSQNPRVPYSMSFVFSKLLKDQLWVPKTQAKKVLNGAVGLS